MALNKYVEVMGQVTTNPSTSWYRVVYSLLKSARQNAWHWSSAKVWNIISLDDANFGFVPRESAQLWEQAAIPAWSMDQGTLIFSSQCLEMAQIRCAVETGLVTTWVATSQW